MERMNAMHDDSNDFLESDQPARPKKLRAWIWIVAAALVLALLAAAAFLLLPKLLGGGSAGAAWPYRNAYITADRSAAYILLPGGKSIKLKDDGILCAAITEDLKHIAVQLQDGTLYVTDRQGKKKWIVAENALWKPQPDGTPLSYTFAGCLGDNALLYQDRERRYHRATYSSREILDLPKDVNVCYAGGGGKFSIAFGKWTGSLYVLPDGADEWTKVGSNLFYPWYVSSDGNTVVWTEYKDGKLTNNYLSENGDRYRLWAYDGAAPVVEFSKDNKLVVVYNVLGNQVWIKERGKDLQTARCGHQLLDAIVTTDAGAMEAVNAAQVKYIYVSSYGGGDLYQLSMDGEQEEILSEADTAGPIRYQNGVVAYEDEFGELYVAAISKGQLGKAKRIASDVDGRCLAGAGKYLYYTREDDSFYGYRIGDREPVRIAADVTASDLLFESIVEQRSVSPNGQYTAFCRQTDSDGSDALYLWRFGDKSPVKLGSGASRYEVITVEDSGGVYYKRYDGDTFDLMYFDGKESRKIGSDLTKY